MDFLELAALRFSCKRFCDDPVSAEDLAYVLEAGRLAPTAKNLQEQHVYVIESAEGLAKVDGLTPCRYGAPLVLMVAFNKDDTYIYPGGERSSGIEDATIVATHLVLAAADTGLDSCWVNNFDPARAHEAFGLPACEEVLMLLPLGHKAEGAGPLANHAKRKPLDETVTYL